MTYQQPGPPHGDGGQPARPPCRAYAFRSREYRVTVTSDSVEFTRTVLIIFRQRSRWMHPNIAAVAVQQFPVGGCTVTLTRRDGRFVRFAGVRLPAAELESQFALRGYPGLRGA